MQPNFKHAGELGNLTLKRLAFFEDKLIEKGGDIGIPLSNFFYICSI